MSIKSCFQEILPIPFEFVQPVSLFLKISVEKKFLDHEVYEIFDDKSPCVLYVHDLTMWSIIKGLKGKIKLEIRSKIFRLKI